MKRTWKTFTTPVKRKAVKDVASLVAKGKSLSAARKLVSRQTHLQVTPNTLYNWERQLIPTREVKLTTTHLPLGGGDKTRITGMNFFIPGIGNITLDHSTLQHIAQLTKYTS